VPGLNDALRLPGLHGSIARDSMPINTRIVMLQSGMRAPLGIKVRGPSLEAIEITSLAIEELIKQVSAIRSETVFAERIVGKPYLEIEIDREAIGRYGLTVAQVQEVLQYAVGGQALTRTVEGRERHPVRVRYMREERDSVEALRRVPVPTPGGEQIPLEQVASIEYVRGPQVIKSEDTFMTGYVIFDRSPGIAEIEAVEITKDFLDAKVSSGELVLPDGVSYTFAGTYQNQIRSEKRLSVLIPLALMLILLILYLQFRRTVVTGIIFSGVAVAISGGFIMLWLYGQPWFMDFSLLGVHMRELFNIAPTNISVAVWVGFIALVGIATDDGVVMATYLQQTFKERMPSTDAETRAAILHAAGRRVRPCLMTTATTLLALLPVITSTGRGSDIMVPMAIPIVGGMAIELVTLFVVPALWTGRARG
jgi:Cu(I)/Ag(I) efflux system membrane protein CusA/SilA